MEKASNSLALIFFPAFDWAISPTHPEREERLLYTRDQVVEEGLLDVEGIFEFNPLIAKDKDINRTHICVPDLDTRITKSHRISAGGAIRAAKAVAEGEADKSFALVRPPGHHARRIVYGVRGFCTINIEAIMIEYLRKNYDINKIAVIDTDCHHGDGTQDIYRNDPDVLFISIHQDGRTLYPGSGFINEKGGASAEGYTLNIPLPPGSFDKEYLYIIENLVLDVLDDFDADIVINSAGQDNHFSDPLTNMNISAKGYAKLNDLLDPDIAVLEGGYSIEDALPYINTGIIMAMAGLDYSNVKEVGIKNSINDKNLTGEIEKISSKVKNVWENRKKSIEGEYKYNRSVFYDTDGINERQNEILYNCDKCNGFSVINSTADSGYNIKAIILSNNICNDCNEKAYNIYNKTKLSNFDYVYLQDKREDNLKFK